MPVNQSQSSSIGGLGGAGLGALAGTFLFPGVGTALGAGIGGALGSTAGSFFGDAAGGGQDIEQTFNFGDRALMQLLGEIPFPGGVYPVEGGFLGQDSAQGGLPREQSALVDAARKFAFDPIPVGQGVLDARDTANRLFGGNLEQALAALQRSIPRAEEIAETGLRTQLPTAALDRQLNERLAQFSEQFGGFRGGTDLFNIGSREITSSDERRALAQAGLDESAAGRKAAAQGLPGTLASLLTQLPQSLGQGLLGFDRSVRGAQEELTRRPLDIFNELRGLVRPTGILQQGFPATDPTAALLGSLAQSIPQLAGLIPQGAPQQQTGFPSQDFSGIGGLPPAPAPVFAQPQNVSSRLGLENMFGRT